MTGLEELRDIQAIHRLKARYFRAMDCKDWTALEAVFAPDLIADFRASTGGHDASLLTHGAAAYVAGLAPVLEHVITVHQGHMPEITVESPTEARGIWAMEDKLWPGEGSALPFKWMHGYGHYHERYVKHDNGWFIQEIRLSRLRVDLG